ncbi:hypothetical protein Bca4012_098385 [Brassica carinata]
MVLQRWDPWIQWLLWNQKEHHHEGRIRNIQKSQGDLARKYLSGSQGLSRKKEISVWKDLGNYQNILIGFGAQTSSSHNLRFNECFGEGSWITGFVIKRDVLTIFLASLLQLESLES